MKVGVLNEPIAVVGAGAITPYGGGVEGFVRALLSGQSAVGSFLMPPFDKARPAALLPKKTAGEWLEGCAFLQGERLSVVKRVLRRAPVPVMVATLAGLEAWERAGLSEESDAPEDNAVVVGGHALGMGYEEGLREKFQKSPHHLPPSYAIHMLDTDHVGSLSAVLPIRGVGFTVGGASASGNMALIQGAGLLQSGQARRCLVVGAMADLGPMALQAYDTLGALGGVDRGEDPEGASRPFDHDRDGFIYAQATGAVVLEPLSDALNRGAPVLALLGGAGVALDGTTQPGPAMSGEAAAMNLALGRSGLEPQQVDLINAHGTASRVGDEVESEAIVNVFGEQRGELLVQSTKGLLGHALWAAGLLEVIASIGQMSAGRVHPNRNLGRPIRDDLCFVGADPVKKAVSVVLSNSFGFGGINTSVLLRRYEGEGEHE